MEPKWLDWAMKLQAIAQSGLTYAKDVFDIERYEQTREIAAQMVAEGADMDLQEVRQLLCSDSGHATPKVDVRGAVFNQDKILMVRERSDGLWTLPGGWADVGESPARAVVREIYEESGYQTTVVKLAAIYDRALHPHPPSAQSVYKLFFLCDLIGGSKNLSKETDGAEFFAEDSLPELSVTRVVPAQIARLFEFHRNSHLPTDFD